MNYCLKGKDLLLSLKRAEWLPPFDDESLRVIIAESDELSTRLEDIVRMQNNDNGVISFEHSVKVTVAFYHQCLNRNYRYVDCYLYNRLAKIRRLRWETGAVLPESIRHDTLSTREKEYFSNYNTLLIEYQELVGLDLTTDLEPPKDLLIEIRVIQDCGKIMTESGTISLDKGSIHYLKRSEVEQLIREGLVEHVRSHI